MATENVIIIGIFFHSSISLHRGSHPDECFDIKLKSVDVSGSRGILPEFSGGRSAGRSAKSVALAAKPYFGQDANNTALAGRRT